MRRCISIVILALPFLLSAGGGGVGLTPCGSELLVVDAEFGDPLIGAQVKIEGDDITWYTSPEGTLDLSSLNITQGQVITLTYISYEEKRLVLDECGDQVLVKL